MCAQQHLYMGVRVGISAKYRTGSTPSSGKKSNSFTGQEYSLCKEKIVLYLLLQTLYFRYPDHDCDVPISFGTLHVLELLLHAVPSSQRWKGQMVRSLTSCCVVKKPALRRMCSCSPVTLVKNQSDLCLSMSVYARQLLTSFTHLLWSRRW